MKDYYMSLPFWKQKSLSEMTEEEWESLCDGCGKCCLVKLEDEDTSEVFITNAVCRLFNTETCRCNDYQNRFKRVEDCIDLRPENIMDIFWLPSTCAYRLVATKQGLPSWHPLVSRSDQTVHEAGISIKGKAILETEVKEEDLPQHIDPDLGL